LLEINGPIAFVLAGVNLETPVNDQERSDCLLNPGTVSRLFAASHIVVQDIPSRTRDARS
jgi:hypothetical protein